MPETAVDDRTAVALAALAEVTAPGDVGALVEVAEPEPGVVDLRFACTLPGYPGWFWTVSTSDIEGGPPTVLEVELLPGDGSLLAPPWVPWTERLAEWRRTHPDEQDEPMLDIGDDVDDDDEELDDELDEDDVTDELDGVNVEDALDDPEDEGPDDRADDAGLDGDGSDDDGSGEPVYDVGDDIGDDDLADDGDAGADGSAVHRVDAELDEDTLDDDGSASAPAR